MAVCFSKWKGCIGNMVSALTRERLWSNRGNIASPVKSIGLKLTYIPGNAGPVIRIGVNDLHVSDMAVYQEITKVNTNFTKDTHFYQFISFPGTSIGETNPARHRVRRKVLTPALSGTRVQELAPLIEDKMNRLLARFEQSRGASVCVTAAAKAFTMDIISKIVLGEEAGCLAKDDFRSPLSDNLQAAFDTGWIGPSFPTISAAAMWVSERVPVSLFPMPHVKFRKVSLTSLVTDFCFSCCFAIESPRLTRSRRAART